MYGASLNIPRPQTTDCIIKRNSPFSRSIPNKNSIFKLPNSTVLQSVPTIQEKTKVYELRNVFHDLSETLGTLISNLNSGNEFKSKLSACVGFAEHAFNVVYGHMSRMRSTPNGKPEKPSSALRSTFSDFAKTWVDLEELLLQLRQRGFESLNDSVDKSFSKLSAILQKIIDHPNDDDITHADTIKEIPQVEKSLVKLHKQASKFLSDPSQNPDPSKELCENLREFSRLLIKYIEIEFKASPTLEVEKYRIDIFTETTDIIQAIQVMKNYDKAVDRSVDLQRQFSKLLTHFCNSVGLPQAVMDLPQITNNSYNINHSKNTNNFKSSSHTDSSNQNGHKENTEKINNSVITNPPKEIGLLEFIERGCDHFRGISKELDSYFESLRKKEREDVDIQKDRVRNLQHQISEAQTQTRQAISEKMVAEDKITNLRKKVEEMEHDFSRKIASINYRIKKSANVVASFLNQNKLDDLCDADVIDGLASICSLLPLWECSNCKKYLAETERINDVLNREDLKGETALDKIEYVCEQVHSTQAKLKDCKEKNKKFKSQLSTLYEQLSYEVVEKENFGEYISKRVQNERACFLDREQKLHKEFELYRTEIETALMPLFSDRRYKISASNMKNRLEETIETMIDSTRDLEKQINQMKKYQYQIHNIIQNMIDPSQGNNGNQNNFVSKLDNSEEGNNLQENYSVDEIQKDIILKLKSIQEKENPLIPTVNSLKEEIEFLLNGIDQIRLDLSTVVKKEDSECTKEAGKLFKNISSKIETISEMLTKNQNCIKTYKKSDNNARKIIFETIRSINSFLLLHGRENEDDDLDTLISSLDNVISSFNNQIKVTGTSVFELERLFISIRPYIINSSKSSAEEFADGICKQFMIMKNKEEFLKPFLNIIDSSPEITKDDLSNSQNGLIAHEVQMLQKQLSEVKSSNDISDVFTLISNFVELLSFLVSKF